MQYHRITIHDIRVRLGILQGKPARKCGWDSGVRPFTPDDLKPRQNIGPLRFTTVINRAHENKLFSPVGVFRRKALRNQSAKRKPHEGKALQPQFVHKLLKLLDPITQHSIVRNCSTSAMAQKIIGHNPMGRSKRFYLLCPNALVEPHTMKQNQRWPRTA